MNLTRAMGFNHEFDLCNIHRLCFVVAIWNTVHCLIESTLKQNRITNYAQVG